MTGFWNPIADFFVRIWKAYAQALMRGLPPTLKARLALIERPKLLVFEDSDDIRDLGEKIDNSVVDVIVRGQLVLVHSFLLPLAAMGDLKNAVRLEVERVMPLESRLIYFTYQKRDRAEGENRVVDVYIVRRQVADKVLAAVGAAGGIIRQISLSNLAASHQVSLPFRLIQLRNFARSSAVFILLVLSVYALAQVPGIYQSRIESAIAETDRAILASRKKTMKIANLQSQVRAMESLSAAVAEKRQASRVLDLLTQLTNASPDSVMIESLALNGNRLAIRGTANAPEDWVVKLQNHTAFSDVALLSVVGLQENNRRRFEMRMDVIWPNARQKR